MKCPFCSESEDKVIDSRLSRSGLETRYRPLGRNTHSWLSIAD